MNGDIGNIVEIFKSVMLRSYEDNNRRKEYIREMETVLDKIRIKYEEADDGKETDKPTTGRRT